MTLRQPLKRREGAKSSQPIFSRDKLLKWAAR